MSGIVSPNPASINLFRPATSGARLSHESHVFSTARGIDRRGISDAVENDGAHGPLGTE
jgi:hypothetical protein